MKRCHDRTAVRRGLTLLELVIVMTILVAIAGIAVTMFPRLLTRAHIATCASNIPELVRAIQMYEAVAMDGYPDRMDTLCVGNALATYLPGQGESILPGIYTDALDAGEAAALNAAGILDVTVMTDGELDVEGWHPTFWPYASDVGFAPVAGGLRVAFIEPAEAKRLGLSLEDTSGPPRTGDRFVIFGLGAPCRMFGRTMSEAPIHFSDGRLGNPNERYMRFVAVYQVSEETWHQGSQSNQYTALARARLRGVVAMHPTGLEGLTDHVGDYWSEVNSGGLN